MLWYQKTIQLLRKPRGFHLVTSAIVEALPELAEVQVGLLHLFLQHTSAGLSINENSDAAVRADFELAMNHLVPEDLPYQHTDEGLDDMPAHIKSALLGVSLSIPVSQGKLALGTWQGIYLCEHRVASAPRSIVATLQGHT